MIAELNKSKQEVRGMDRKMDNELKLKDDIVFKLSK